MGVDSENGVFCTVGIVEYRERFCFRVQEGVQFLKEICLR